MLGNKATRPANRYTGFNNIIYRRASDGKTTNERAAAHRWYECGDDVAVIRETWAYKMIRNSESVSPRVTAEVIARVKRKDGRLWTDALDEAITKANGRTINYNII